LAPSGIGVVIEFWKIKKTIVVTDLALRVRKQTVAAPEKQEQAPVVSKDAVTLPLQHTTSGMTLFGRWHVTFAASYESKTKAFDDAAMFYLMCAMIPCLLGYTVYSALYDEHKGWYSFLIGTQVRFIYFFGFAMMTPQLFINYKLKSVTSLPWRTFVYKALNTFIDDLFAFIIKMPMMHRLACFRDDVVFLILLYQRWIYPVDLKRTEDDEDDVETATTKDGKGDDAAHEPKGEEVEVPKATIAAPTASCESGSSIEKK
jgi:hypothetical protein